MDTERDLKPIVAGKSIKDLKKVKEEEYFARKNAEALEGISNKQPPQASPSDALTRKEE